MKSTKVLEKRPIYQYINEQIELNFKLEVTIT